MKSFNNPDAVVRHCILDHPAKNVSFLWPLLNANGKLIKYKPRIFNIKGSEIESDLNDVSVRENKLHIPTRTVEQSPVHKCKRLNTPTKHVHKRLFVSDPNEAANNQEESIENLEYIDDDDDLSNTDSKIPVTVSPKELLPIIEKLTELLPEVTQHLSDNNRLEEWTAFFHLVTSGNFSVDHIASQLFWDVVKFSQADNMAGMRFTPAVKEFWAVGLSLFHSKFIRYMGGFKGRGLLLWEDDKSQEKLITDSNNVNFVVPHYNILKDEIRKREISCQTPGIIHSNIQRIAECSESSNKNYKLCIDGKKITVGFGKHLGEVDLYGHESSPTLKEKRERLNVESVLVNSKIEKLDRALEMGKEQIKELNEENKSELLEASLDIISVFTEHIKELRLTKIKREQAVERLLKMSEKPWQQSPYCLAISSMKTHIHRLNICIADVLRLNESLGMIAATCNDQHRMFCSNKEINLNQQSTYVCLKKLESYNEVEILPEITKQRTDKWFEHRKTGKATGSTLHKAIGLSTLREQQQHFDRLFKSNIGTSAEEELSTEVKKLMKHGEENEINAVGVIVGKIIPVFAPESKFYEEGCYIVPDLDNKPILVVSPDGSLRINDTVIMAIEIKCPLPGKVFVPDVHYKIPTYYICQILSEMAALQVKSLLYVCWTPESCTVFRAQFDETLWLTLLKELTTLYGTDNDKASRPKKKNTNIEQLKEMVKKYSEENVVLLAEFSSVFSVPCNHCDSVADVKDLRGYHGLSNEETNRENSCFKTSCSISFAKEVLMKGEAQLLECYNVLRIPAKEVIVAMISDLDRMKKRETPHAFPVAYGLSGYSLKVESVRSMVSEIIEVCHEKGITIRCVSTDGQFYKLCVRDAAGKPLTIIQVAKDTWEATRKMPKQHQVQQLMSFNRKEEEDEFDVETVEFENDTDLDKEGIRRQIVVKGLKNKKWVRLYNPINLQKMMRSKESSKQTVQKTSDNASVVKSSGRFIRVI